jgi:hypothetical protein
MIVVRTRPFSSYAVHLKGFSPHGTINFELNYLELESKLCLIFGIVIGIEIRFLIFE